MRWLVCAIALLITVPPLLAVGIEFEDDFDSYGTGVECNAIPDQYLFAMAWDLGWCNPLTVTGDCPFWGSDPPFYIEHGKNALLQNVKDLVPVIQALDSEMNAVNGRDSDPLLLTVHVYMKPDDDKEKATTFWIQLYAAAASEVAPNAETLIHNNCVLTNETQSNARRSIAFGGYPELLPWEPEPEGCNLGYPPILNAYVLYNGDHWTVLETDVPVQAPGPALRPVPGKSRWEITIKTNTIDITVIDMDSLDEVTRTDLPRAYKGPFQWIGMGCCEMSAFPSYIDQVALNGGYLTTLGGACCLADGSCNDNVDESDCTDQSGVWKGEGSTCAGVTCCPVPWADIDFDGDVDQVDHGLWQHCYSGPGYAVAEGCECYDRDNATGAQGGDGDVDVTDFNWFASCATGPTVPLDIYSPPPGCFP